MYTHKGPVKRECECSAIWSDYWPNKHVLRCERNKTEFHVIRPAETSDDFNF